MELIEVTVEGLLISPVCLGSSCTNGVLAADDYRALTVTVKPGEQQKAVHDPRDRCVAWEPDPESKCSV